MSTFAVTVETIARVVHHPGADRLDLAVLHRFPDWQFVVGRASCAEGDRVIYFPIDSLLPATVIAALGLTGRLVQAWRVGAFNLKVLDDGIWRYEHHGTTYRFIGSTWWSAMDWTEDGATGEAAFARVRVAALGCLNDYGLTHKDGRFLTPDDSQAMHALSTRFLQQQIAEAQATGDVPIVVTHFLPSRSSCHEQYRGSLVNAYFANDRDELTIGVPLWIHGHTHCSFDYVLPTGCRVVCNPRGYGTENRDFEPGKVVAVPASSSG